MQPLLAKDYIDLKIDTERHTNGQAVAKRLTKGESKGFPWSVILDAKGKELITSDGPGGNIGCPVKPDEQAHFMDMIGKTRQALTDEQVAVIRDELAAYAKSIGG